MFSNTLISIILLSLLTCSFLKGQNDYLYYKGDTLYVWAKSGLNLRSQPDIHSAVLSTVPYGHSVTTIESWTPLGMPYSVKVIDTVKIGGKILPDFTINGYWAEVEYLGKKGFVFDGFLSRFQALKIVDSNQYFSLNLEEYGILKVLEERGDNNSDHRFQRVVYNNGIIGETYMSIGGYGIKYIIPGGHIKDGLLMFMIASKFEETYKARIDSYGPRLMEKSKNKLYFSFSDSGQGRCIIEQIDNLLIITIIDGC